MNVQVNTGENTVNTYQDEHTILGKHKRVWKHDLVLQNLIT